MKTYEKYKDSGVEWIGQIPSHWEVRPLKVIGDVVLGKMLTSDDNGGMYLRPYLRSINIQVERVDFSDVKEMWFSESELVKLRLKKGDVLLNEGGDVGRTCIWNNELDECYIQNSVNRVRLYSDNPHFFKYLSSTYHRIGYYDSIVSRVSIPHLTKDKLEGVRFITPPLTEQEQIVSFLDKKTSLIDDLINKKEQKIGLLKEYRTSLINRVITKGLNPDCPMKDSGVEWIGEIPSHWDVKRIKHHSVINVGLVINPSTYFSDDGVIPIITGKNVKPNGIDLSVVDYITKESNDLLSSTQIYEGDIVSMRVGYPGRSSVVSPRENGINCCSVIITRKSETIIPHLLNYQLNSNVGGIQVEHSQGGMGQQVVNLGDWREFLVLTPPLPEQEQIVYFLDEKTGEIDRTIQSEQKKIELLKEYRQSLISSVITGKIKVVN